MTTARTSHPAFVLTCVPAVYQERQSMLHDLRRICFPAACCCSIFCILRLVQGQAPHDQRWREAGCDVRAQGLTRAWAWARACVRTWAREAQGRPTIRYGRLQKTLSKCLPIHDSRLLHCFPCRYNIACCHAQLNDARSGLVALSGARVNSLVSSRS